MILLALKAGDKERLSVIKRMLEQGKNLDHSDVQYLEKTVQGCQNNDVQNNSDVNNSILDDFDNSSTALGSLNEKTANADIWNALEVNLHIRERRIKFLGIGLLSASVLSIFVWPLMVVVVALNAVLLGFISSPWALTVKIQAVIESDLADQLVSLQDLGIFMGIFAIVWIFVPVMYKFTRTILHLRNLYFYLCITQFGNVGIFIYQHVTPVGFLP